jgi:crotonobetainyl-CoA:carnitine CoA-transferase CaiB-like acyl-CoA transferase
MSVTGREDMPPVRAGTSVADMTASLFGVISILSALQNRHRTGTGQHVRVPLFESTVTLMGYWLTMTDTFGEVPGPQGASHPNWAPYDIYATADEQWVFIGPASERHWEALCEAIDAVEITSLPRFATVETRRKHSDELDELLSARIREFDRDELVERLRRAGIPAAPVNDTEAVLNDEHLAEAEFFATVDWPEEDPSTEIPGEGEIRVPTLPFTSSAFSPESAVNPPSLGADTTTVLKRLGYSDAEIESLIDRGII